MAPVDLGFTELAATTNFDNRSPPGCLASLTGAWVRGEAQQGIGSLIAEVAITELCADECAFHIAVSIKARGTDSRLVNRIDKPAW